MKTQISWCNEKFLQFSFISRFAEYIKVSASPFYQRGFLSLSLVFKHFNRKKVLIDERNREIVERHFIPFLLLQVPTPPTAPPALPQTTASADELFQINPNAERTEVGYSPFLMELGRDCVGMR